jgi:hypothetical protein
MSSEFPHESRNARRSALKTLLVGGGIVTTSKGLPEAWTRPVVDAVMLPAHAQTSACEISARSVFEDENERSIGIFDESGDRVGGDCCASPLEVNLDALPPGIYIISMGIDSESPVETTLTVTTCSETCAVTREIQGGDPDGSGNPMVRVTVPGGECEELVSKPGP